MEKLLPAFLRSQSGTRAVPQEGIAPGPFLGYIRILPQKSWFVRQSVDENADGVADIYSHAYIQIRNK